MESIYQRKKEYGGFLPLELNNTGELFAKFEPNLMRFNSVKASISHIIHSCHVQTIFLPYYYCPSTIKAIRETGIDVQFYHIGEDLLPKEITDKPNCGYLLVNYFGVRTKQTDELATKFHHAIVIVDRAHAFFDEPIFQNNVYNVYSAKKFFGIPDGSYIVSSDIEQTDKFFSSSFEYADFLILTYEEGTNRAYIKKKESDELIANHYDNMSGLAYGLLCNVDYSKVKKKRIENFAILTKSFAKANELLLENRNAAYHYPLLISNFGKDIKRRLIENKIYVPTLWNGEELLKNGSQFERNIAENAIFIPMDQRYNTKDMEYIINLVLTIRSQL